MTAFVAYKAYDIPMLSALCVTHIELFSFECRRVIGFAITLNYATWWAYKNTHSIFHPVRSKTKSNHDSFEHLSVLFMLATGICNKLLLLIGSLYCLCNLWLAGGITLVLVLWRSIGNCFNTQQRNKCKGKTTSGKTVGTRTTLESRGVGGGGYWNHI